MVVLGGSISRQFWGESLKVRKYLKKVVFNIAQYKGDPRRMKTRHSDGVGKIVYTILPTTLHRHQQQLING